MAIASGVFSAFVCPETASFQAKNVPSLSLRRFSASRANLRLVTCATTAKPATGERVARGITKPRRVSPEMQEVVGLPEISRTQALKQIWAHIKQHGLQDPENKKVIVCDEKLKKIFGGKDRVGFLEIAGLIGPHFL